MLRETAAPVRVLLVSRAPRILAEIKKALMESFDIRIASTGEAALAALEAYKADIIVICVGEDREAAFRDYKEIRAKYADIPALFLAERDSASDEAAAFGMGASDYCLKRDDGTALAKRLKLRIRERQASGFTARTALIAEDVAINRDIMSAILGDIPGLSIEFACDGLEALETFKSCPERYSIIFMDIHMPVMDGLAAAKEIRKLEHQAAKSVPIIALTASSPEDGAMLLYEEAGMNGQLEKPMERERFLEFCSRYILR